MTDEHEQEARDPGYATWRQFHGLCLDLPAPDQREIDARLQTYRRVNEVCALRDFGAALLLIAAVGRAFIDFRRAFASLDTPLEAMVFALTCVLLMVIGAHTLSRLRRAVEHRALARHVGADALPWGRIESMFADTRSPEVREYLQSVREQGRGLRRAEAAVALERARGRPTLDDLSMRAFSRHVRDRSGTFRRQMATALVCLIALAAARTPDLEGGMLLPALMLLAGWSLASLLATTLQRIMDPWELRDGGTTARSIRAALAADAIPEVAVIAAVIATSARLLA